MQGCWACFCMKRGVSACGVTKVSTNYFIACVAIVLATMPIPGLGTNESDCLAGFLKEHEVTIKLQDITQMH